MGIDHVPSSPTVAVPTALPSTTTLTWLPGVPVPDSVSSPAPMLTSGIASVGAATVGSGSGVAVDKGVVVETSVDEDFSVSPAG